LTTIEHSGMYEEFLRRFWADCDRGELQPMAIYLARYPDLADLVREEYQAWLRMQPGSGAAPRSTQQKGPSRRAP